MKKAKRKKLEAAGWKVGNVEEFLGLSPEEAAFIEMKLALARRLRQQRVKKKLTQEQLARLLRSSQSRVAKMEAADASVTIDSIVRALLILGATRGEVAKAMQAGATGSAA